MSSLNYAMTLYALWKVAYVLEYTYNTLYYTNKIRRLLKDNKKDYKSNIENELSQDWIYIQKDGEKTNSLIIQNIEKEKK
jgi:hypothetical protein